MKKRVILHIVMYGVLVVTTLFLSTMYLFSLSVNARMEQIIYKQNDVYKLSLDIENLLSEMHDSRVRGDNDYDYKSALEKYKQLSVDSDAKMAEIKTMVNELELSENN